MRLRRLSLAFILCSLPVLPATFGTVVKHAGGYTDIVLDQSRPRLYLVDSTNGTVQIYNTAANPAVNPPALFTSVSLKSQQPLSAALSADNRYLYVTCYATSSLAVIDLNNLAGTLKYIPMIGGAKPEGVAVGADGRVLIGTVGTATGQASLIIYDPSANANPILTPVNFTPPATPAILTPPPSGRTFMTVNGRLLASNDRKLIVGVNNSAVSNGSTRSVFVYDSASGTVLASRSVPNASTVLSISPDNAKFMAGSTLFDIATLQVLGQQNASNSPFTFTTSTPTGITSSSTNFNLQQNQGGSLFTPDGRIWSAFNIAPVQSPAARANVSQLLRSDADNLMIDLGVQLTENLSGKMVAASNGNTAYALSESGFVVLPLSSISQSPLAQPDTAAVLLTYDQCGVTARTQSGGMSVNNAGSGRMNVTATLLQSTTSGPGGLGGIGGPGGGGPGGGIIIVLPPTIPGTNGLPAGVTTPVSNTQASIIQTAPTVRLTPSGTGASLSFQFNSLAARSLGTIAPHDFLIQSNEAINIAPNVLIYQNYRNAEAKGAVIPVSIGASSSEGLVDMVTDATRQRLYIANSGLNRVEVFDMRGQQFLSPIKVGQLPRSLALGNDGVTLYAANSGGESISVVDLDKMQTVGRIKFPPIPFNAAYSLVTPSVIASSARGPQIIMSDGSLWKVVGDTAVPRALDPNIFGTARTIAGPVRTMASTPGGEYVLVLDGAGVGYLYDAINADDFIARRQIVSAPITGYYGPIAAGPKGQYYVVNNLLLNEALTVTSGDQSGSGPIGGPVPGGLPTIGTTTTASTRPVAAVAAVAADRYLRFSAPTRTSANTLPADPGLVEMVDTAGRTLASIYALELPLASAVGTQRTNMSGRTLAVDPAGTTVYALTTSGLSILPLDSTPARDNPSINPNGAVNPASYLPQVAPGGLLTLFGNNMGSSASSDTPPYPVLRGGACVTLGTTPAPLIMTAPGQINAQIPPELAAGRYSVVVRNIDKKAASNTFNLTVSKYAPAVFVAADGTPAILHLDGTPVTRDNPASRDEELVIYATGLGATKGGKVTAGQPAPSSPLAVTDKVQVFFGNPGYKEAAIIVEWSGLAPGKVGMYQINIRVPGAHINGDALPVQIRIGGVNSPSTGPAIPKVAVH